MYYAIIRELHQSKNTIAWSQSEFLFREYSRAIMKRYPYSTFHIESCNTEDELMWLYKKYNVPCENMASSHRIILIYDRTKTVYGVTTCKTQFVGLGGRSLFQSKEDAIRCNYVHKMFWLVLYLKRFSLFEPDIVQALYTLVADKFLDRQSIDMYRYLIDSETQPNVYKL